MLNETLELLRARTPLPPLLPQQVWNEELSRRLTSASNTELCGVVRDDHMADCVRAGLLLWNDDLDASHKLSQQHDGDLTADYWHAIMHRREGDAANSRYWWQRVGTHEAFSEVRVKVLETLRDDEDADAKSFASLLASSETWQPQEFVARCELVFEAEWTKRVQAAEMDTLLEWCLRRV